MLRLLFLFFFCISCYAANTTCSYTDLKNFPKMSVWSRMTNNVKLVYQKQEYRPDGQYHVNGHVRMLFVTRKLEVDVYPGMDIDGEEDVKKNIIKMCFSFTCNGQQKLDYRYKVYFTLNDKLVSGFKDEDNASHFEHDSQSYMATTAYRDVCAMFKTVTGLNLGQMG